VRRAAELVGGRETLARTLQVPLGELEKWLSGERKPPREVFLRVVDIIIDDGAARGEPGAEPPAPRESAAGAAAHPDSK
jgi:hypothetical protein